MGSIPVGVTKTKNYEELTFQHFIVSLFLKQCKDKRKEKRIVELWDIYDVNRNKTGRTIDRNSNERLKQGEYHLVVEAIIINSEGKILLTKRAKSKNKYPLMWECTGGSCLKGENTLTAILREVREEIGVNFKEEDAIFLKTLREDNAKDFKDIWLFRRDIEIKNLKFTDGEVIEAKWVDIKEFEIMCKQKEVVPSIDFTAEDYEKCLKL